MLRKLAHIGEVQSTDNSAREEDIQGKHGTSNVKGQQIQSSGIIREINAIRPKTKVWSRISVGMEGLLLLSPWDARVTEYRVGRQLDPEKRNPLKLYLRQELIGAFLTTQYLSLHS